MISGGENVDILLVLIGFPEKCLFSQVCFFCDFWTRKSEETRSEVNPMSSKQWKSLYESDNFAFLFFLCFFVFRKSIKNDDFRSPFGATILVKTVIFSKCQGGLQLIMVIWSGPFGRAPVVVLVIFKVARRRPWGRLV